jgi:hypothetical protein
MTTTEDKGAGPHVDAAQERPRIDRLRSREVGRARRVTGDDEARLQGQQMRSGCLHLVGRKS